MRIDHGFSTLPAMLAGTFFLLSTSAAAQFETPPEIQVQSISGGISASVEADGAIDGDSIERTGSGLFFPVPSVFFSLNGLLGSEANAWAQQFSDVSRFRLDGQAVAFGKALRAGDSAVRGIPASAVATSASDMSLEFVVPVDAEFTLQGSFSASGTCCLARGTIGVAGIDENNAVFQKLANYKVSDPDSDRDFLITGTVGAGQTINFGFSVNVYAESSESVDQAGEGNISLVFSLDFGDRDGDGLLDSWEENGIDFPASGRRIDLPGMGADPDHKDIFVELDIMEGVPFSDAQRQGLDLVHDALAAGPRYEVRNPDGEPGYTLHIVTHTDERVPFEALSGDLADQILVRLDQIKDENFGTAEDRAVPAVIEAREQIFRYALWADTLAVDSELISGLSTIGGPDFVIAAGELYDRYSFSNIADNRDQALAGAFGHELGHSLGMQHGGLDSINYKPNYLSIMNYAYALPLDIEVEGGGNLADFHTIDYSRYDLAFESNRLSPLRLPEENLLETLHITSWVPEGSSPIPEANTHLSTRYMWWNSAFELDEQPIQWALAPVLGQTDWNGSDSIESHTQTIDLNRVSTETPANYQSLQGTVDFRWMRLPIMQSTLTRTHSGDLHCGGIRFSELDALEALPTVNLAGDGDLVFGDGFEATP